jgi:hypothetical protein
MAAVQKMVVMGFMWGLAQMMEWDGFRFGNTGVAPVLGQFTADDESFIARSGAFVMPCTDQTVATCSAMA